MSKGLHELALLFIKRGHDIDATSDNGAIDGLLYLLLLQRCRTHSTPLSLPVTTKHVTLTLTLTLANPTLPGSNPATGLVSKKIDLTLSTTLTYH